MKKLRQYLNYLLLSHVCSILFTFCAVANAASTPVVVLHLKSGDQISGLIVSKNTNRVIISNAWVEALSIPRSEITSFQTNKTATASTSAHPATKGRLAARRARVVTTLTPSVTVPAKSIGIWHGQINIGTSIILSRVEQRDCSVHAEFVYLRPYQGNPRKFFRNTIQFGGEYQRTDNHDSANHAHFNNKADFDLWNSVYAYGQDGAGYDRIQNIDFQDHVGPGGGLHLVKRPSLTLNAEAGVTYQHQYNRDAPDWGTVYLRLADEFTWNIWENLKLTENVAFYPDFEHVGQYHSDFASALIYRLWKHLIFELRVTDHYNTQLSGGAKPNEFDFRSSLGYMY